MAATQGTEDSPVTATVPSARRGRRTRRSRRLRLALGLLVAASVLVVVAVVLGEPLVLTGAAVLTLVVGWASYRLAGKELIDTRRECAAERTGIAESYRDLFARRATESAEQQQRLRGAVSLAERRADGTEAMLEDVRRRLGEAEERYAAMQSYGAASPGDEPTVPVRVVPEWARLEADPVEALLAWEEHAGRRTGSHVVEERKRA